MALLTKDELIERLNKFEWNDVEFKLSQRGVSEGSYETVSAFSNTEGGYLVFGVRENQADKTFDIVGVIEVDKVQNEFLSCLRTGNKFNNPVSVSEDSIPIEDKTLLVFYVPEAERRNKPVYLNGDIRKSYIRRGGCDETCNKKEIEGFLRDASDRPFDADLIKEIDVEDFYNPQTLAWYRSILDRRLGSKYSELNAVEFLNESGFVLEENKALYATRAAVLLFGKDKYVTQVVHRIIVDYQRIDFRIEDWNPELRWNDRLVIECNLIEAWKQLFDKYSRLAELPFSLDDTTLQRNEDPPDYKSFREATINLLIHQDYGDLHRKASLILYKDTIIFWNPGNALSTLDRLLDGTEKEVRNPLIVRAFRQIGLSEQAGTGIRTIMDDCRKQGFFPAVINNNKSDKYFELQIPKEKLVNEQQLLFQAQLGVTLTDIEANIFAFATQSEHLNMTDVKAITGLTSRDIIPIMSRLENQKLIDVLTTNSIWKLAAHLRKSNGLTDDGSLVTDQPPEDTANLVTDQPPEDTADLVTDQPPTSPETLLIDLSVQQRAIILLCETPKKTSDLMQALNVSHRDFFRRTHLKPLINAKIITMTHPEDANHPDQAYKITEVAIPLLLHLISHKDDNNE